MQKILSYISGWLAALGWQAFIASSAYQTGNVILILASMQNPSYVPTVWWVKHVIAYYHFWITTS